MPNVPGLRSTYIKVGAERIQGDAFKGKTIETLIDHIEYDESCDPLATRPWEDI